MDGGGEWDGQWGGMVGETGASRSCGMVVVARNGGRRGLEDEGEQRGKKRKVGGCGPSRGGLYNDPA